MMRRGWKHYGPAAVSKNPYFSEMNDRITKQTNRVRFAQWLLGIFGVLGVGGVIMLHPALRMHTITITGVDAVFVPQIESSVSQILQQHRFKLLPNNHYLFYPEALLQNSIAQTIYAEHITIRPQWGGILTIAIQAYPTALFWKAGDRYFAINHQGIITEQIPKISNPNEAVVIEDSARETHVGQSIIESKTVDWLILANTVIKNDLNQIIDRVYLSLNHPEIIQIQMKQLVVTLNSQDDVEAQILRLKIFLGSKPSIVDEKHTIDLRFKEKIYYH